MAKQFIEGGNFSPQFFITLSYKRFSESVGFFHVFSLSLITEEGRKEMFYLTTHSTHFIYSYMASDIWKRTIQIAREETRCCHMGYSFWLTARVLLYAPSHRQDSTYHSLCYTSHGALAGMRNSPMVHPMKVQSDDPSHHEWMLLPRSYILLLISKYICSLSNYIY